MTKINSSNNSHIPKCVNWDQIFLLNEQQQYLGFTDKIEVSLASRLIRKKYMKIVFNSISVNHSNLLKLQRYFMRDDFKIKKGSISDSADISNFQRSTIDPFIDELFSQMSSFSKYFKSLSVYNLAEAGYFIIPSVFSFSHLTRLSLIKCSVYIYDFTLLARLLSKLECLDLKDLLLLKSPEDGSIENDILISESLKEFSVGNLFTFTSNSFNKPYEYLFESNRELEVKEKHRLIQHLPNLEKFKLHSDREFAPFIAEFLTLNPQISNFTLYNTNLNFKIMKILSENDALVRLTIIFQSFIPGIPDNVRLPCLNSLTSLHIPFIPSRAYSNITKLTQSFTNLTRFSTEMSKYDSRFISILLDNLKKLKIFNLSVKDYITSDVDLTIFSSIEVFNLNIFECSKIFYKLPSPPKSLKSVTISSDLDIKKSFDYMSSEFKQNNDWDAKLIRTSIICRSSNNT